MANVTSFEVLAQPVVPGVPNVPYVQQGSFLQLTNTGTAAASIQVLYNATPAFVATSGQVELTTNYIDPTGNVTMIAASIFLAPPVGFPAVTIAAGGTYLFGVQYIIKPTSSTTMLGSTPQSGVGTRGLVVVNGPAGTKLAALATVRQVFTNFTSSGAVLDVAEAAYSVPIIGGPVVTL